jgi:hypothetical protein
LTENDDGHSRDIDTAGLIICDAIADALDRLRQEMPTLTAEEMAAVFERAVKVTRHTEGWPEAQGQADHETLPSWRARNP